MRPRDADDLARLRGSNHLTRVLCSLILHPGADNGNVWLKQRDCLALHVRPHQGAVGIVMLQKGDQRRTNPHHLARCNVHVIDRRCRRKAELLVATTGNSLFDELASGVQQRTSLSNRVKVFLISRHVPGLSRCKGKDINLLDVQCANLFELLGGELVSNRSNLVTGVWIDHRVPYPATDQILVCWRQALEHTAIRCLDESESIHLGIARQSADEPNVWAFRCLYWTNAAVMTVMHITDLKPSPLAAQTARP